MTGDDVCAATLDRTGKVKDVEKVDATTVKSWAARFPRLRHRLDGWGFPCKDLSRLRGLSRLELHGPNSGHVRHLPCDLGALAPCQAMVICGERVVFLPVGHRFCDR